MADPEALLVVFTSSGKTAIQAALLRPRAPIYAFTKNDIVCRNLTLARGVRPFTVRFEENPRDTIAAAIEILRLHRDIATGTPLVVVSDTLQENQPVNTILLEHA